MSCVNILFSVFISKGFFFHSLSTYAIVLPNPDPLFQTKDQIFFYGKYFWHLYPQRGTAEAELKISSDETPEWAELSFGLLQRLTPEFLDTCGMLQGQFYCTSSDHKTKKKKKPVRFSFCIRACIHMHTDKSVLITGMQKNFILFDHFWIVSSNVSTKANLLSGEGQFTLQGEKRHKKMFDSRQE